MDFDTHDGPPDWSRDGPIAFVSSRGGLFGVRPDGTGMRGVVSRWQAGDPEWSPDGRWIAYGLTTG